uniref:Uncharacterized protein n=1 Tax=Chromera velia CCMP2878 TaxID=1169474 RepID=A0A0G4FI24_9ALVE|eukprot:Cvel_16965.t1-p1 / transcript=Cvel_16965.t1 / gene=Cvel_16965 / organism=Chromera_velia_CCMP2878 / gene_product=hypothetical protein / transcript_product=hypothetical protein / location=Cvel_scaffold1331:29279-31129(+) / protein_length=377 / sequence_SO=supercontig / SO=protein_coding / is_pseudo=false
MFQRSPAFIALLALALSACFAAGFSGNLRRVAPFRVPAHSPSVESPRKETAKSFVRLSADARSGASTVETVDAGDGKRARTRNMRGFLVRPAAAVEQGGGFFIPGLEGWRLNVAFPLGIFLLATVNHVTSLDYPDGQLISEAVVSLAGLALILQGLAVREEEERERQRLDDMSVTQRVLFSPMEEGDSPSLSDSVKDRDKLEWAADALTSIYPGVAVTFLEGDGRLLFHVGDYVEEEREELERCLGDAGLLASLTRDIKATLEKGGQKKAYIDLEESGPQVAGVQSYLKRIFPRTARCAVLMSIGAGSSSSEGEISAKARETGCLVAVGSFRSREESILLESRRKGGEGQGGWSQSDGKEWVPPESRYLDAVRSFVH